MSTETKTKHTAEPWKRHGVHPHYILAEVDGGKVATVATTYQSKSCDLEANAARIVACINACAGVDDPLEAIQVLRDTRDHLKGIEDIEGNATRLPASEINALCDLFRRINRALGG